MTKQLIIRLSGQASGNIPWVLWQLDSDTQTPISGHVSEYSDTTGPADHGVLDRGVLDHGVLDHAAQLSELAAYSRDAQVTVLVSSTEIGFHVVDLPPGSKRHLAQVVPYALEEELAQDIHELHFAWQLSGWQVANQQGLPVVVVAKQQMQQWTSWLDDAGLSYRTLIPDLFILPLTQDAWSAMSLDDDIIVRHSAWRGFAIEQSLFADLAGLFSDALPPPARIRSWGPMEWPQAPAQLVPAEGYSEANDALLLARTMSHKHAVNLLQGEYEPQRKRRTSLGVWRWPAIAAAVLVGLLFIDKGAYIWQLNQQSTQLNAQIEQRYRDTFPNETRVVNVRAQLNQHLARLQGGGQSGQLLMIMTQLSGALSGAPLEVTLLQFDAARNELRIQASGASFATFETFRELAVASGLEVEQGQLSNRQGRIAGTIVVRGAVQGGQA